MPVGHLIGSIADLRRKLRALTALAENVGATEHERASARVLKARLEQRLRNAGSPAGDWTDNAFRLGKRLQDFRKSVAPVSAKGDWTDHAFSLGKALRRGYKKWQ